MLLHLELDDVPFSKDGLETVFTDAEKQNPLTVLVSGDSIQSTTGLREAVAFLAKRGHPSYLQLRLDFLKSRFEPEANTFFGENIRGLIVEADGSIPPGDSGLAELLKTTSKLGKTVALRLNFFPEPSTEKLSSWLDYLDNTEISDLMLESGFEYLEEDEKKKTRYFELFIQHSSLLHRIPFQCSFLKEFKPKRCLYLDSKNPAVMYKNGAYVLCPYQAIEQMSRNETVQCVPDAIETMMRMQKIRLVNYVYAGKPFTCGDCVRENSKSENILKKGVQNDQ